MMRFEVFDHHQTYTKAGKMTLVIGVKVPFIKILFQQNQMTPLIAKWHLHSKNLSRYSWKVKYTCLSLLFQYSVIRLLRLYSDGMPRHQRSWIDATNPAFKHGQNKGPTRVYLLVPIFWIACGSDRTIISHIKI